MQVLAFSASLRSGSYNKLLLNLACSDLKELKVKVDLIDLRDYDLPAYDADIQSSKGILDAALRLGEKISKSDAIVIASPEYNFSFPGHFKNTIDWVSRIKPMPFMNKSTLLMSASMSVVGGNRGLWSLRIPLESCGSQIYADMFSLAQAHQAFSAEGELLDNKLRERLKNNILGFTKFAGKLL